MSAKHTPGPWQVHGSHVYGPDHERELITQCHGNGGRMIANRNLIAAAPDAPHYCTDPDCKGGQLMRELENLTPGGSEYVGDVERCIEAIKRGKEMAAKLHRKMAERLRRAEQVNAELLDGLKAAEELLAFHEGSANPATEGGQPVIWVNGEDWQNLLDKVRAAIARAEGGQR